MSMTAKPIRVLIVDDSRFFRDFMARTLSMDLSVEVVGGVSDPSEVMQVISETRPNILTLDIEIQNFPYREYIQRIRKIYPDLLIVVISPLGPSVFDALKAGAVDFVSKPSLQMRFDNAAFMKEVLAKIKNVYAGSYPGRMGIQPLPAGTTVPRPAGSPVAAAPPLTRPESKPIAVPRAAMPLTPIYPNPRKRIIAIGASTGGTEAIVAVVKDLPANTPGVVIVQHMPPVFTRMYADRLDKICRMSVREAKNGDRVEPGLILLAEGSKQMRVVADLNGYYVRVEGVEKVSGHCPSVDVLFDSVAHAAGHQAVGVILTGMGGDGAKNLLKMREAGAYTIGQDEATCVVYGMPMVAHNLGAVVDQLPLESIGAAIVRHLTKP